MPFRHYAIENEFENFIWWLETLLAMYSYVIINPLLVWYSNHQPLAFLCVLLKITLLGFGKSLFERLHMQVQPSEYSLHIFGGRFPRPALWTISLMIFPLQLVFLNQSDLSQAFKCLVLLPFILKSNFMVLANTTVNLRNTFLVWLFQMVVEILLVDFSVHEYSFLVFANLIYLQLGSSALIETYQTQFSINAQTQQLTALHKEITVPLQHTLEAAGQIREELQKNNTIPPEGVNEFYETTHTSSVFLVETIEQMQSFSRVLDGSSKLRPHFFKTQSFLQEIKVIASIFPRQRNVALCFEFEQNLPEFIFAERTVLQQIILNLLSNAMKFTQRGSVTLKTFFQNKMLYFVCKDTGQGMSEDFIKNHLFIPYNQESGGGNRPRGLGLGLALSKYFIQQMGGAINVESKLGEGTAITVHLVLDTNQTPDANNVVEDHRSATLVQLFGTNPQKQDMHIVPQFPNRRRSLETANPKPRLQSPLELPLTPTASTEQKLCALVVDDNNLNRRLLAGVLNRNGFTYLEAASGEDALSILQQHPNQIHCVLLDMFMPGLSGIETCKRIEVLTKSWTLIPFIVGCSGNNSKEVREQFQSVNVTHFLDKPIHASQIADLKNLLIQRHSNSMPLVQNNQSTGSQKTRKLREKRSNSVPLSDRHWLQNGLQSHTFPTKDK